VLSWGLGNNGDEVPPLNLPLLGLFFIFFYFFFLAQLPLLFLRGGAIQSPTVLVPQPMTN